MGRVGADADLRSGEAHRLVAGGLDRHREQGHADLLAGGEEHVHLAGARSVGDLLGEVDEDVGLVAHGADHDDHLVARPVPRDRLVGGRLDLGCIGDTGAAELLHDEGHLIRSVSKRCQPPNLGKPANPGNG